MAFSLSPYLSDFSTTMAAQFELKGPITVIWLGRNLIGDLIQILQWLLGPRIIH